MGYSGKGEGRKGQLGHRGKRGLGYERKEWIGVQGDRDDQGTEGERDQGTGGEGEKGYGERVIRVQGGKRGFSYGRKGGIGVQGKREDHGLGREVRWGYRRRKGIGDGIELRGRKGGLGERDSSIESIEVQEDEKGFGVQGERRIRTWGKKGVGVQGERGIGVGGKTNWGMGIGEDWGMWERRSLGSGGGEEIAVQQEMEELG